MENENGHMKCSEKLKGRERCNGEKDVAPKINAAFLFIRISDQKKSWDASRIGE